MATNPYTNGTTAAKMYDQGLNNLVDLGNKYKDNESLSALVTGTMADSFRTQMNNAAALQYNNSFMKSLGTYQQGIENLRTGNTMKLMSAEGGIAKDLIGAQGEQNLKLQRETNRGLADVANINAGATKYTADKQAKASMYGADKAAQASMYGADKSLEGTKAQVRGQIYGYDKQLEGTKEQVAGQKYGYDKQLEGTKTQVAGQKYGYDKQLEGTKITAGTNERIARFQDAGQTQRTGMQLQSQEKQIGLQGNEQRGIIRTQGDESRKQIRTQGEEARKELQERTRQEIGLRKDARGAISRQGARFFG